MTPRKPVTLTQPEAGNLIRELRQTLGLSQEKFAAALGVTFPTINRWENGRANPSPIALRLIEQMLQALETASDEMLRKEGEILRAKYF
jgi:putative transcriptional regulator